MKISNRNTCLHQLTDPIPVSYAIYPPIGPNDEMEPPGPWPFHELRPIFARKIQYLTQPFMDAFKTVGARTGGFPRWQVYGPDKSERKLIWVPPFEKHGYTRKAKMLGGNDNPTS